MKVDTVKINRLQDIRLLTARQLADVAGISHPAIYAVKQRGSCSPDTAGRIAQALCVSVTEILPDRTKE